MEQTQVTDKIERLTIKNAKLTEGNLGDCLFDTAYMLMCWRKLQEYENLNLTPDEIKRIIRQNKLRGDIIKRMKKEQKG